MPSSSARMAAVWWARYNVEEAIPSNAPKDSEADAACHWPISVRGGSARPCQRAEAFQVDWPWRTNRIRLTAPDGPPGPDPWMVTAGN